MGIVKIPSCSKIMAFSNNCLLFLFSWERGFLIDSGSTAPVGSHQCYITSKWSWVRKRTHCLAILWCYMAYLLWTTLLCDSIISKASSLCYCYNSGVVVILLWIYGKQAKSTYMYVLCIIYTMHALMIRGW